MQLTIDSDKQSLDDVLRVISALYQVEVPAPTARSSRPSSRTLASATRGHGSRTSAPITADVRAWAIHHGHPVNTRGRIPTNVLEAYKASIRQPK